MKLEAVFLDRDGVLNPHIPGDYLYSADKLIVLPGVALAVRRLNNAGLPVIVISNQQGVGKGLMTMDDLLLIERRMGEALAHEAGGAPGPLLLQHGNWRAVSRRAGSPLRGCCGKRRRTSG